MRLSLYSSVPKAQRPNLVSLQDEALSALPTVLVCPLKSGIVLTALRVEVAWNGDKLIACCDLARPIRRSALRSIGFLDAVRSEIIMERFLQLLAR